MYNRINSTDLKIKRVFDGGLGIGNVYGITIDTQADVNSETLTEEEIQIFLCISLPKIFEADDPIHNHHNTITVLIKKDIMFETFKNRFKLNAPDSLYELWKSYHSHMSVYMTEKLNYKKNDASSTINMNNLQTIFIVDASLESLNKKDALMKRKVVEYTLKRLAKIAEITDSSTVVIKQNNTIDKMYNTELSSYKNIDFMLLSVVNMTSKIFSMLPLWKENTIVELFSINKSSTRKKKI